jgi:Protein of unknown function (DUF2490)
MSKYNGWLTSFLLMSLLFLLPMPSWGLPQEPLRDDVTYWSPISFTFPIHENVIGGIQIDPENWDGETELGKRRALTDLQNSALLGYQVTKSLSLAQGYVWATVFGPKVTTEHYLIQQALLQNEFPRIRLTQRIRLEERFLPDQSDAAVRARYLLRTAYLFGKHKDWSLVCWDDIFINLNSLSREVKSGLDQNRIFLGMNHQFNEKVLLEGGYMMQYLNRPAPQSKQINNGFGIFLYVNLTPAGKLFIF